MRQHHKPTYEMAQLKPRCISNSAAFVPSSRDSALLSDRNSAVMVDVAREPSHCSAPILRLGIAANRLRATIPCRMRTPLPSSPYLPCEKSGDGCILISMRGSEVRYSKETRDSRQLSRDRHERFHRLVKYMCFSSHLHR